MNKKDASYMLKDQINESMLRVNAAKFGHSIEDIAPQYTNSYYLPDKSQYVPEKQVVKPNKNRNMAHNRFQSADAGNGHWQGSPQGSRYDDKSLNGGNSINMSKHHQSRNGAGVFGVTAQDGSPRLNFAKNAQVDFMNNKALGRQAGAPFAEKQNSSIFMTEAS